MNPIVKNTIAAVAGWIAGSAVNMSLIKAGYSIMPIEGIDPEDMEALAAVMPTLDASHFIFPFLAHALGTLVGATVAYLIAANHKMKFALVIGLLFFIGGIMINRMLPGPTWFVATDLLLAYFPMAWLGGKIGESFSRQSATS